MDSTPMAEDFSLVLDPEVDEALATILDSKDPLDAPNFDPVAYINDQFPDEEAMTKLNTYSEDLKTHIDELEEQILQTVRDQSEVGRSAESDVEEAKQTISDLFGRIMEIKEKAAQSEEMVQVICKNISKLDTAKRNLTESLNALARLQMFLSSLEAAEALKGTHQYIKAARSMAAVMQLSRFFDKYKDIENAPLLSPPHPQIQVLLHRVMELRDAFCTSIFTDFDQIEDLIYTFDDASNHPVTEDMIDALAADDQAYDDTQVTRPRLQAACYVIDAMGAETRDRLVKSFCMLLDLHSLKTLFLQLPTVQQNETDEMKYVIPPTYTKFVNKAVDKADMMLKLLGTPVAYLASSMHNIMPDGTEDDLVTILTVKGVTKAEKAEDVDDNERFRVMNTDARTYSVLEEDEKADYEQWLQQRDLVSLHSLKMSLIKEHPVIQVMYHRLVPSVVSDSQFWNFYFFHMEKAGYDFYKGQEHVEEKSEPTVGSPVKELLQSKELEEWSDVDLSDKENPKDLEEAVADVNGAIDVDVNSDDWGEWE
ncbi:Vps53-like protein [Blastocystis sp. ATCC 50177/Nand II]|uniref:Vps53-like protein n=1 Tax=Blastocystis sp. subtype 1 (strain ATCC 50177 / NandII) TaxID=478820 RepID=A0A196S7T2_BLAHN|nr:Vps53-like protein [Blastocystis sp. ATCC 50177/Nand II]